MVSVVCWAGRSAGMKLGLRWPLSLEFVGFVFQLISN